ncbi:hypothetical protein RVR_8988 [Actinacidiphila reveromycinica]|uniref:Phenazine biosynthesis protein n=1 Tax=Actinacidiphila reveromycinica TaxID=659352 RepID=A0A7U3UZJ2_9ACTN|nr:PhzF family phenazine biosynthesis protein [Streptomyces sp. SN-593]BBB01527.1 hypothetical protein RVR_8988 [Streptomyces sp. SN-593]
MPTLRTRVDVLSVLCGPDRRHGSEVAVVRDGRPYPDPRARQELAGRLGCPHTVFVDDPERGAVEVHRPGRGVEPDPHALIGAAWLLDLEILEVPALGDVFARHDGEFGWVTVLAGWAPPRVLRRYPDPEQVRALPAADAGERSYAWAWSDEAAGRVVGAERGSGAGPCGGPTGAGALLLAHHLQRALNVTEAPGAQILCAPGADGTIEIGGRVFLDPVRQLLLDRP